MVVTDYVNAGMNIIINQQIADVDAGKKYVPWIVIAVYWNLTNVTRW